MMDWSGWSEWVNLSKIDLVSVPIGFGAYVIKANRSIHRAVGIDEQGFLDIGESSRLRRRLADFRRCATLDRSDAGGGHMAGWRYTHLGFNKAFPYESLSVCWTIKQSKSEALAEEARVMTWYVKRHFELPPLNYKFNWTAL